MSAPSSRILASDDLDWSKSGIWVANATPLKEKQTADGPQYIKPSGEALDISEEELRDNYYSFNDGEFLKPHLKPEQAVFFTDETEVVFNDGKSVTARDFALILSDTGAIKIVHGPAFKREYRVVGYRGSQRPTTPFSCAPGVL